MAKSARKQQADQKAAQELVLAAAGAPLNELLQLIRRYPSAVRLQWSALRITPILAAVARGRSDAGMLIFLWVPCTVHLVLQRVLQVH